ncbi:MAG: hypothetical protein KDB68_17670, partial [Planctomycetes bacterium]|nr:hypothetical protein [Planctomycetota bacterium]
MIDAKKTMSWARVREVHLAGIPEEVQALAFDCHRNTLRNWEKNEDALSKEASIFRRLAVCIEQNEFLFDENGQPRKEPTKLMEEGVEHLGGILEMKRAKASESDIEKKGREFRLWLHAVSDNTFEDTLGFRFPEEDTFEPTSLI